MKKLLLTGGTGGIGKSIAKDFNANGYFVIIMGRNKEKFDKLILKIQNKRIFQMRLINKRTNICLSRENYKKPPT